VLSDIVNAFAEEDSLVKIAQFMKLAHWDQIMLHVRIEVLFRGCMEIAAVNVILDTMVIIVRNMKDVKLLRTI